MNEEHIVINGKTTWAQTSPGVWRDMGTRLGDGRVSGSFPQAPDTGKPVVPLRKRRGSSAQARAPWWVPEIPAAR